MSETPENRRWVWRSTEESREAGQVSVLAVAETLVCVTLYWILLLWLGVTWHHWMILIATPLVLLRSEQSVALGVKWINAHGNGSEVPLRSGKNVGIVVASFAVSGLVCWFVASHWLADTTGWLLFAKAMALGLLGAIVGFAIAVAITVPKTVAVAGFGIWLRAILMRFTATARFLAPGLVQFPANWRFSTTVSDIFHPPDLIPGDEGAIYGKDLSLSLRKPDGTKKDASDIVVSILLVPIFFGPALLWRWAIKATAWFYLPLLGSGAVGSG